MNAADVLGDSLDPEVNELTNGYQVDALLAVTPPGEGVYIAPDRTLMALERYAAPDTSFMHRLVPVPIQQPQDREGG